MIEQCQHQLLINVPAFPITRHHMQLLIAVPTFLICGKESHFKKFFECFRAVVTGGRTLTVGNKVGNKNTVLPMYGGSNQH